MSLNSLGRETPHSNGMTSSRMTHSLSTPSGVDGSTSNSHHSRGGKKLAVRIQMLDDSMTMFQVQVSDTIPRLLRKKCKHKAQFTSEVNDSPRFGSIFVRKGKLFSARLARRVWKLDQVATIIRKLN